MEEFRFLSAMKPEQKKQEDLISEFQLTFHWQQSSSRNKKRPASTGKTMAEKGFEGVEYFAFQVVRKEMHNWLKHCGVPLVRKTFANRQCQDDRCSKRGIVQQEQVDETSQLNIKLFTHK